MLTAYILFWTKLGLFFNLTWVISFYLDISFIWLDFIFALGILSLVKWHIEVGLELVLLFAKKGREKLAIKVANNGTRLLQKSIKKSQDGAGDDTVRTLASTLVEGVNRLIQKDCRSILVAILDNRINAFSKALRNGQSKEAEGLSRVSMAILNAAMELGHDAEFTVLYLSKAFVKALHESSTTQEALVKQLVNDRAMELHTMARKDKRTAIRMLTLSMMTFLRTAGQEKYNDILRIIAGAITTALMRAINENVGDVVQEGLKESVDGIYKALIERNTIEAANTSISIQALLIAAHEAGSPEAVKLLADSWVGSWDRACHADKQCQQELQQLIAQRGAALEESIRVQNPERDNVWAISFELLLTTVVQEKFELRDRLSRSLVKGLVGASSRGDEGPVSLLLRSRVPAITSALSGGNDSRAKAVSSTALQLLLTAIIEEKPNSSRNLINKLSQAFVGALDAANLDGRQVLMDGLLEDVRTNAFTNSIDRGSEEEALNSSTVGIELLLAAIRIQKMSSRNSLAKSWVLAIGNAVIGDTISHASNIQMAEMLISAWGDRLAYAICSNDETEARNHGIAAVILCLTAREVASEAALGALRKSGREASHVEGRERVAASLERSLVRAMATAIEEHKQRSKVDDLLYQIKDDHFIAVMNGNNLKEVDLAMNLIQKIADLAKDKSVAVYDLVRSPKNWGEYLTPIVPIM